MKMLKAISVFSVLLLLMLPMAVQAESAAPYMTRREAADFILQGADDHSALTQAVLLQGYADGSLREEQPVTLNEVAAMLVRTFDPLPTPGQDRLLIGGFSEQFTDTPLWAQTAVTALAQSGILPQSADGLLHGEKPLTKAQLQGLLTRIWALKGTDLKDDFYATINKEWLATAEIPAGQTQNGTLYQLKQANEQKLATILEDLAGTTQVPNSAEQKLADFYQSCLNMADRNAAGLAPIAGYLSAIEEADNLTELAQVANQIEVQTGSALWLDFAVSVDQKASDTYLLQHEALTPGLDQQAYLTENQRYQAYRRCLTALFTLAGESAERADSDAVGLLAMEKDLSAKSLAPQEYYDIEKTYNSYTFAQLKAAYPVLNLSDNLAIKGLQSTDKIIVADQGLWAASADYLQDAHLPELKAYLKIQLLSSFKNCLSADVKQCFEIFRQEAKGVKGSLSLQQEAAQTVQGLMPDYLGRHYIQAYFSAEAKADLEKLVQELMTVYQSRLSQLTWMSPETKVKAQEKLAAMTVKVGYPEHWDDPYAAVTIGADCFTNYTALQKALRAANSEQQGQAVDKSRWSMNVFETNACYVPVYNEIIFPAGILQPPYYDFNSSNAQKLGGIGCIIAHEISHAFDNAGAKYDQNGNAKNWWTQADQEKFAVLCQRVEAFYDQAEVYPGVLNDGKLTLGENIADLGGVSCALAVLDQTMHPDYQQFFAQYALIWAAAYTREELLYRSVTDVHSPAKLRVNRVLVNMPQFYQTYHLSPSDGMYVPPAERVAIW